MTIWRNRREAETPDSSEKGNGGSMPKDGIGIVSVPPSHSPYQYYLLYLK